MTTQGAVTVGLFVGGRSRRMGGAPKGLLAAPDTGEAIVVRAARLARACGCDVVLVGEAAQYAGALPEVEVVADAPAGVGPLGGLAGLLARVGEGAAVALACDMPFVTEAALRALVGARGEGACVAARRGAGAPWEPFFARYDAARALPVVRALLARGERSMQRALEAMGASEVAVDAASLDDWDTPEDVTRCRTP